jgi:hypothetical protein
VPLLVLSSHLIGVLLLLLQLKLPLHFHWVHLLHLVGVHIHHSWVHLMHLSWIHLDHIWVLLVHHLLLNTGVHSLHVHVTHWGLVNRYFLLCWRWLFLLGWWLLLLWSLLLRWLFPLSRWLLITHIYFNIQKCIQLIY